MKNLTTILVISFVLIFSNAKAVTAFIYEKTRFWNTLDYGFLKHDLYMQHIDNGLTGIIILFSTYIFTIAIMWLVNLEIEDFCSKDRVEAVSGLHLVLIILIVALTLIGSPVYQMAHFAYVQLGINMLTVLMFAVGAFFAALATLCLSHAIKVIHIVFSSK